MSKPETRKPGDGRPRAFLLANLYAAPNFALYSQFDAYEPTFLGGVEVG